MQIQQSILGIGLFLLACNGYANEVHMPENPEDVIVYFDKETIEFSLMIVVVDAFMRCNIL